MNMFQIIRFRSEPNDKQFSAPICAVKEENDAQLQQVLGSWICEGIWDEIYEVFIPVKYSVKSVDAGP